MCVCLCVVSLFLVLRGEDQSFENAKLLCALPPGGRNT